MKKGKEKAELFKKVIREAWSLEYNNSEPMNHNNIIIFAFRYGLERNTGAPLMIASYIKANIGQLNSKDIRDIIHDIEKYKVGEISEEWFELLDFLRKVWEK